MICFAFAAALLLSLQGAEGQLTQGNTFEFAERYTASGYIFKPSFEIHKHFTTYNIRPGDISRADFYGGEVKKIRNLTLVCEANWSSTTEAQNPEWTCRCSVTDRDDPPWYGVLPDGKFEFVKTEPCDTDSVTVYASVALHDMTCRRYATSDNAFTVWVMSTNNSESDEDLKPVRVLETRRVKTELIILNYTMGITDEHVFDMESFEKSNNCSGPDSS